MKIYFDNKKMIEEHNAKYQKGLVTYTMKMNHLGDLMNHEVISMYNGFRRDNTPVNGAKYVSSGKSLPASVDWRTKGAVTPIKDQGQCGSCWAFSAVGSLEGQHFLKTGKLVSLSEQNLVDCSGSYGNEGCNGGLMDQAFQYVKANGGLDTESSYSYTASDGRCKYNPANAGATCTGNVDINSGDENSLMDAVANVGPISVAIDAGHNSFQFYSTGVYSEPECSSTFLDHGVLAVGYGTENGQDYWLVKNSWGTVWGESGYIKMTRNKSNQCGIATTASYPTV
ncbi:hypothetical protein AAG570_011236 [Ranatra chinensis]|uniref:Cathepsin L n=1 Tax=Ranatra chinensis TaxID=642074 RepID=A0ABD0YWA3_9HEMI